MKKVKLNLTYREAQFLLSWIQHGTLINLTPDFRYKGICGFIQPELLKKIAMFNLVVWYTRKSLSLPPIHALCLTLYRPAHNAWDTDEELEWKQYFVNRICSEIYDQILRNTPDLIPRNSLSMLPK